MLELIYDNRAGDKLEIVVPTLNEESRTPRLVRHYSPRFDVVVLDDGSADATVARTIAAGGTVFRRTPRGEAMESFVAHYVNNVTRSGLCFCLFADEFVPLQRLAQIEALLRGGASGVLCRRRNYFFAREVMTLTSTHPRGFRRGSARYHSEVLHGSLLFAPVPGHRTAREVFEINHLHISSTRIGFGTAGSYTFTEVGQFLRGKHPRWRFLRRYVFSLGAYLLWKWRREKNLSGSARLILGMERLVVLLLGTMSWLEQSHMPTAAQQQACYDEFFATDLLSEQSAGETAQ